VEKLAGLAGLLYIESGDSPQLPTTPAMVKGIHSHAHEEGIPGTVNLKAVEGDDTYLGQALFPVPSADPNDPLNWPKYKYTPSWKRC